MTTLVTGATGTVGRALVAQLVEAGERVRALSRDPRAANLPDGVELVRGDLTRPDTMKDALAGVDRVHLLTTHQAGEERSAAVIARMARDEGVRRVTVMSGGGEEHVVRAWESAGIECVHLAPGEFMANTLIWADSIRTEGVVRAPFGGWTSAMIHEADIAAVAAVALIEDGHAGKHYSLTSARAHTRVEVIGMIGEAIGKNIRFIELTDEQAREYWVSEHIFPPESADWLLSLGPAALANQISPPSPIVEEITGRPARGFAQWAREHASDFR